VLDRHGIPAAVLAGFSWGASIACHFAAARPERTLALVLLEGGHVDFADVPELGDERGLGELVADEGLAGALAWGLRREPAASTYSALRGAGVPMLLVTALRLEAATALRVDPLARLSAEVPQAEIRVVARGGHSLLDEDADALAGIVGDWLARTVHGAAQRGR
jgi:pimeloyl-ACP methyl ester carboxylesterase